MHEPKQFTIMVVENNVAIAQVVADVLRLYGLRVIVCLDSQRAQQQIAELQPDLVILDVEMPGLNGIDLFTRLRDDAMIEVPVIFFTADPSQVTARLVDYKARGAALIAKPNIDQLPLMVLQALEQNHAA